MQQQAKPLLSPELAALSKSAGIPRARAHSAPGEPACRSTRGVQSLRNV
jgi:hypothetical protein